MLFGWFCSSVWLPSETIMWWSSSTADWRRSGPNCWIMPWETRSMTGWQSSVRNTGSTWRLSWVRDAQDCCFMFAMDIRVWVECASVTVNIHFKKIITCGMEIKVGHARLNICHYNPSAFKKKARCYGEKWIILWYV